MTKKKSGVTQTTKQKSITHFFVKKILETARSSFMAFAISHQNNATRHVVKKRKPTNPVPKKSLPWIRGTRVANDIRVAEDVYKTQHAKETYKQG
mmetsp:Transcript_24000/g.52275  ORF Transcript_24000/g.52275 Transcript_24000/m.52275 type:complete len:95 (+) Transcript_24000:461-745(+)